MTETPSSISDLPESHTNYQLASFNCSGTIYAPRRCNVICIFEGDQHSQVAYYMSLDNRPCCCCRKLGLHVDTVALSAIPLFSQSLDLDSTPPPQPTLHSSPRAPLTTLHLRLAPIWACRVPGSSLPLILPAMEMQGSYWRNRLRCYPSCPKMPPGLLLASW